MEHEDSSASTRIYFCNSCLCPNNENVLHYFHIRNVHLQGIFQTETINLCTLCKTRAQQVETFIQNVESNQLLLENFHKTGQISKSTCESIRSQINLPSLKLSKFDIIDLGGPNQDISIEESFNVSSNSVLPYSSVVGYVKVKQELKIEVEDFEGDSFDEHFLNEDLGAKETDLDVKLEQFQDEDEYPLTFLKEELSVKTVNRKILKASSKKTGVKGKHKKKNNSLSVDDEFRIEPFTITKEQCMQERLNKSRDEKYKNSIYHCEDCVIGFTNKDSYDTHMQMHSKNSGSFECDICRRRFQSKEKLLSHSKYHSVRFKCTVCGAAFATRIAARDHYTASHCDGLYQYTCLHCFKVFKRHTSLRKHIAVVHSSKERVQCDYCNKTYKNKQVLKSHFLVHHPSAPKERLKRYACSSCGAAFSAPSLLRAHALKHTHRRDYYCVECDKSFKSEGALNHHLKTTTPHVSNSQLPFGCSHCSKRFPIRRDVEQHTNRIHLNIKPYKCDKCDKAYVTSWSLKDHQRLIHEGYKRPMKFPCTMCDKIFDRNCILKSHMRTHTGERPFACARCGAAFAQRGVLATHVRLVHLRVARDGGPKRGRK